MKHLLNTKVFTAFCIKSALMLGLLSACQPSGPELGDKAWSQGDYGAAISHYKTHTGDLTDTQWQRYATALGQSGFVMQGAELLSKYPMDAILPDGQLLLARSHCLSGKFEAAAKIRTALEPQMGQDPAFLAVSGECLAHGGNLEAAEAKFTAAYQLDPTNLEALIGLGDIAFGKMATQLAQEYYEKALQNAKGSADGVVVRTRMARLYAAMGEVNASDTLLNEVQALMPEHPMAQAEIGKSMVRLGFVEQAIPLLTAAQQAQGDDLELMYHLGYSYLRSSAQQRYEPARLQDLQSAEMWFSRVIARDEKRVEAIQALGQVKSAMGDFEGAEAAFSKAFQMEPTRADPLIYLGRLYAGQGMVPRARAAFSKGLDLEPQNIFLQINLGVLALREGDQVNAEKYLMKGDEICQKTPPSHQCRSEVAYQLARLAGQKSDIDGVAKHLQVAFTFGFSDMGRLNAEADLEAGRKDIRVANLIDSRNLRISN